MLHVKCFFFSFLSFFIYFISGSAVIGFLAVAMTLPNVYILSITFCFFFFVFGFIMAKLIDKKYIDILHYEIAKTVTD